MQPTPPPNRWAHGGLNQVLEYAKFELYNGTNCNFNHKNVCKSPHNKCESNMDVH